MEKLTKEQLERYNRHIILEDMGVEGQEKIMSGRVLVIGAGGLGSPVILYLAAAGVGTLGIMDADVVDLSNLHRQVIHGTGNINKQKTESAEETIKAINPDVTVTLYRERATAGNIRNIIKDYDFVIDATDNFDTKYLINDACILENVPYSHAGVLGFVGQTMTIVPGESACFRCVLPVPPPPENVTSTAEAGVLGVVPGVIGTIQATEALKFLSKTGDLLTNFMIMYDAKEMTFRKVILTRSKKCPVCGKNPTILKSI
jgi:molybdopterin/thiamine biosynthesis adenylyltransferase